MHSMTPETFGHIAKLARIGLPIEDFRKSLRDFETILAHFEELGKIDTGGIAPMIGAADAKNAMRSDDDEIDVPEEAARTRERIAEAFPDREEGYLEVQKIL